LILLHRFHPPLKKEKRKREREKTINQDLLNAIHIDMDLPSHEHCGREASRNGFESVNSGFPIFLIPISTTAKFHAYGVFHVA
jgi:hypothetical protein